MKHIPHNPESERAIVGSAIMRPDEMPASLQPQHFYDLRLSRIWRGLLDMTEESKPIDLPAVCSEALEGGWLDDAGGAQQEWGDFDGEGGHVFG